MKNAPGPVQAFVLANNVAWRADLYTVTLLNGTVYRWTTCDRDLVVSAQTYTSGVVLSRGNLRQTSRLEVDTLEVQLGAGILLGGSSIALLAVQGAFDEARLQVDHILGAFPGDLSLGPVMAWFEGRIATVDPGPQVVKVTVQSDLEALTVPLPKFNFQLGCMHAVYDANCALSKAGFTSTSTATGTPTRTVIACGLVLPVGYFNLGVVTFTSGVNNGIRRAVQSWSGSAFTMALPFPSAPAAGDTFSVYPGCDRTQATCNSRFGNTAHFRGFPHIPVPEGGK